jgi:hypothetical protein
MDIKFGWAGLTLEAEIDYTPGQRGRTSGPWEDCYPDEDAELDILALACDGTDASFLLNSRYEADIYDAAHVAAEEKCDEDDRSSAADWAADRMREAA